jgi:hypothetical protein
MAPLLQRANRRWGRSRGQRGLEAPRLALALLLCGGCTAENPDYLPFPTSVDAAADEDLRSPPGTADLRTPAPDLAVCQPGARHCRQADGAVWVSQLCREARWADDRRCPVNAGCSDGYCTPPPPIGPFEGKPCQRENDCFSSMQPITNVACQPFVDPASKMITGFCALQISRQGTGFPGTPCRPPDGVGCRSGFCDEIAHEVNGRDVNFCFRACEVDSDCPNNARSCREALITVEQIPFKGGRSCIP